MKSITITICIFTNLLILGMCGYFYLLLSQYWSYWSKHSRYTVNSKKSVYDKEIFYYNHGYPNETHETVLQPYAPNNNPTKQTNLKRNPREISKNETILIIKDSKPRFINLQNSILELDSNKYMCKDEHEVNCSAKIANYKNKLSMELQRILMKEGDVFNTGVKLNNPYNVYYTGIRENFMKKTVNELICQMKKTVTVNTITRRQFPFNTKENIKYFPKKTMFKNKTFNSCAIIASAGSLLNSNLGAFIDEHDIVLRFNHAPTEGYEKDVGRKTTVRILNSQVVTKSQFNFLTSDLYTNISILVWDPSNYTASLIDWYHHPEYPFFPNYKQFRINNPRTKLFLLNPQSLWSIWNFLQSNSLSRLRNNPPSSGFLALAHLLNYCSYVDLFEYIPSVRITRKCHYFDLEDNPACTFGAWHPLAAEKLIAYAMNIANDYQVFQNGFIRIPGYSITQC